MSASVAAIYWPMLAALVLVVASLLESYKKVVRKDKASIAEIRIVAFLATLLSLVFLVKTHVFKPLLTQIGASPLVDYVIFVAAFYWLQLNADMKVIKMVVRYYARAKLKNLGLSDEVTDELLNHIKKDEKPEDNKN